MMSEFEYDVFVSYSSKDRAWVKAELLRRLEARGLTACIDFRDFELGLPAIENMEQAARVSRRTVFVLSPAYLESQWTKFETLVLQTADPANQTRRFIPVVIERCQLPERLGIYTYANFANPEDEVLEWERLLKALGKHSESETRDVAPEQWFLAHPFLMPHHFTGRSQERQTLTDWLESKSRASLLVVRALGGFGKSALCWRWLHEDVDRERWQQAIWWSFYETDASFGAFFRETVRYLLGEEVSDKANARELLERLLRYLQNYRVLLVLDGFERELRAYDSLGAAYQGDLAGEGERDRDCISPLAEVFLQAVACLPLRGRVLMTTRLRPSAVEAPGGFLLERCEELELQRMSPEDAVAFFRALQIEGTRAELEAAGASCGYHPLSLRLLAGLARKSRRWREDIEAVRGADVTEQLQRRQHHVLQQAYQGLTVPGRELLSKLACFRSPVEYEALQAIAMPKDKQSGKFWKFLRMPLSEAIALLKTLHKRDRIDFEAILDELEMGGLLNVEGKPARFDLHPIVRRYAYARMGNEASQAAHAQLRDYFAAVPPPERVQRLEELNPQIELYHHTVRSQRYQQAFELFRDRLHDPLYFQFGAYQRCIELLRALFPEGEAHPPKLEDAGDRAWVLNSLALSYALSGQPAKAIPLFEQARDIAEEQDSKGNLAIGLGNLAYMAQLEIGALRSAEANLRRSAEIFQEIEDEFKEAIAHRELGRLLAYRGSWHESESELAIALAMFEKQNHAQLQGVTWAYRSLRALLMVRAAAMGLAVPEERSAEMALSSACKALELAEETARIQHPYERDYVRAYWLLGAACRVRGNASESDPNLTQALTRCRAINLVEVEADILLELAQLRPATEAKRLATEALAITERAGYVLQGADAHLVLARLARTEGNLTAARRHARQARQLATCDGLPDYIYKVAYEEADRLLQEWG